jgi:hypothetical protein
MGNDDSASAKFVAKQEGKLQLMMIDHVCMLLSLSVCKTLVNIAACIMISKVEDKV